MVKSGLNNMSLLDGDNLLKESEIPSSLDWRSKGDVTGVKDQGNCADDWAVENYGQAHSKFQLRKEYGFENDDVLVLIVGSSFFYNELAWDYAMAMQDLDPLMVSLPSFFEGACWSFSATGAIDGINKIVAGSFISLSEQELIDCDKSYNAGCGGGLMDYAYELVMKNKKDDTEEDYPFQGRDKKCNNNKVTPSRDVSNENMMGFHRLP